MSGIGIVIVVILIFTPALVIGGLLISALPWPKDVPRDRDFDGRE